MPRGAKIVIARTLNDGNNQSSIALDKVTPPPQIPKQPSNAGVWVNDLVTGTVNWFWNNSNVLSYIMAAFAIGILIFVGIIRFRKV